MTLGVEFIAENGGGAGVRSGKAAKSKLDGAMSEAQNGRELAIPQT